MREHFLGVEDPLASIKKIYCAFLIDVYYNITVEPLVLKIYKG